MEVKDHILQAATEVFARSGYGGARIAEIAHLAGVNKATIYYHIGGKEELYREVLHRVIGKTATFLEQVFSSDLTPLEKIQAYIETINLVMDENPHIPPIVIRELATGGEHFPQVVIDDLIKILRKLGEIIDQGVQTGQMYPIHPFLLHLMIAGTLGLYRMAGTVISRVPQIQGLPDRGEFAEIIKDLMTRALFRR